MLGPHFAADAFTITPAGVQPINATPIYNALGMLPDRVLVPVSPATTTATLTCRWTATLGLSNLPTRASAPVTVQFSLPAN